jgi:heme-degrading monooxygenase HmoA
MFARVTPFEIDTLRIPLADAERMFDEQVVPRLAQQPGLLGYYVMRTPEGKGLVVTLWETEAAATAGIESGYYDEQVAKFVTFMRQPPGREHYEVIRAQIPANASAGRRA